MHSNESNKGESYHVKTCPGHFYSRFLKKKKEYIENIHKMHKKIKPMLKKNDVGF